MSERSRRYNELAAQLSSAQSNADTHAPVLPTVDVRGLSANEVVERKRDGRVNTLNDKASRSVTDIVRANVFTLFNGIIFAAMILVLLTGSWKDSVFGFVIIINTGIGIVTELKAKRTLDRLSILVASDYAVRRDEKNINVHSSDIVLDDLLWVRAGEQVPADARIMQSWGLEVDESMLTGESRTVRKQTDDEIYSGSTAVSGVALTYVTAVGEHSYAATLTAQAKVYKKTISDLNRGINTILKFMTFLVVPLCVLLIFSQIHTVGGWSVALSNGAWRQAVVSAVAGVVGMIPEGLVLLTSLNFAVAAMRLARHDTLVQELESVETLARVDCLNLDKTGTITDGGISCDCIELLEGVERSKAEEQSDDVQRAAECMDSELHGEQYGKPHDEPHCIQYGKQVIDEYAVKQALYDLADEEQPNSTGRAVLAALQEQGFKSSAVSVRVPFSSARKWSAITDTDGVTWYMGAPEVLLAAFDGDYANVLRRVNDLANSGNRVLMVAAVTAVSSEGNGGDAPSYECEAVEQAGTTRTTRTVGTTGTTGTIRTLEIPPRAPKVSEEPELNPRAIPVALVLCSESVRDDAEATLAWFRQQGVRCRIISGDNPVTVGAIAAKVHLTGDSKPVAMDARNLPEDINELSRTLERVDVIGRVLPDQKKQIVQALHASGHVVAMTGDGVNDSLAIKEADLGIAMGNAAPATKAVAQVVLVDSRFSHLPDVVARGRQVMANMERVASLFLVKTVYSALISLGVVLTAIPFPYLPRHITYVGALTIGAPAFILALAPNTRRYIPGFLGRVVRFALPGGIAVAMSVLLSAWFLPSVMGWTLTNPNDLASLRATCAIVVFALGVFVLGRVASPLLSWRGVLVATFAAAGVIGMFIPFVARFFALQVPSGNELIATAVVLLTSAVIFTIVHLVLGVGVRIISHSKSTRQS